MEPAVGVEDSEVEVVVDLFEGGDEGFVVVVAVGVGEGFACAEFFEQVVHAGDGDFAMGGLDLFAMSVEAMRKAYDPLA